MKNKIRHGVLFSALLLVGLLATSGIAAGKEVTSDKLGPVQGKDNVPPLTYSPQPLTSSVVPMATAPIWSAKTDLYNYFLSPKPRLYTESKSRRSGIPYDINKISVRGRIWKNGESLFDKTVTKYNSADANINWESSCIYCAGSYTARGDHAFVKTGSTSWSPITYDSLNVGV